VFVSPDETSHSYHALLGRVKEPATIGRREGIQATRGWAGIADWSRHLVGGLGTERQAALPPEVN
jgi:hypothetical protein